MIKKIVITAFISILMIGVIGCSSAVGPKKNNSSIRISDTNVIAYAYLNKNGQLITISKKKLIDISKKNKPALETVLITTGGFYPNYSIQKRTHSITAAVGTSKDNAFFDSYFTSSDSGDYLSNALTNTFIVSMTSMVAVAAVASGQYSPIAYTRQSTFSEEKFFQFIKDNNLPNIRKKILSLNALVREKNLKIANVYTDYFNSYKTNLSNIKLEYIVQDNSGLVREKSLNADYNILLNAPERKVFDYSTILSTLESNYSTFDKDSTNIENQINNKFQKDMNEYKSYLEESFLDYKIKGPKEKTFRHNQYISYEGTIQAPDTIKYKLNKKIIIPITITIHSATLNKMLPKIFTLEDHDLNVEFNINPDLTISAIATNNTQSFLTIKSLTSYCSNYVNNISDINREIAPESVTLSSNSNYNLLSKDMKIFTKYEGITKAKAKTIKVVYGYALKYKTNDTNKEKSLYKKTNYSLLDILEQYI